MMSRNLPVSDGVYCGGPVGLDSNTLYSCTNGCHQSPAGTADYCEAAACAADGHGGSGENGDACSQPEMWRCVYSAKLWGFLQRMRVGQAETSETHVAAAP